MKQFFKTATLAGCPALGATSAQAASVSIAPCQLSHFVGDIFTVDVNISGLGSEVVSAFDFKIYFDPSVLAVQGSPGYALGAGIGAPWDDLGSSLANQFGLFSYTLTYDLARNTQENDDALAALQADNAFTLLTLSFRAIAQGTSNIFFGTGFNEREVVGRNAAALSNTYANACVVAAPVGAAPTVCPTNTVPAPASSLLVALAGRPGCAAAESAGPAHGRASRAQTGLTSIRDRVTTAWATRIGLSMILADSDRFRSR